MTGLPCHLFFGGTMRTVSEKEIVETVKKLFLEANYKIPCDVTNKLIEEKKKQSDELTEGVIDVILRNNDVACKNSLPICQDTGMAVVFVRIGNLVHIDTQRSLQEIIDEGVAKAYAEGYLRMSVVADPLFRNNTKNNTPSIVYTEIASGDKIEITALPKGFGSENMSRIKMFNPTASRDDVIDFIVSAVKDAGANPCPPIVVGVGIGGTFDYSAVLSKKALMRPLDKFNEDEFYAQMEKDALEKVNELGIGVQGLGGPTTALKVNIEKYPTHIAGLPVAVNICCHVMRHKTAII